MDESKEWEYIKERIELFAENKGLKEKVIQYEKDMEELQESMDIARVGRRDLINYVKQLKEEIERLNNKNELKTEFTAKIISDSFICNASFWTTEYYVEAEGQKDFDDIKKQFEGKRVKITIEEIEVGS